MGWCTGNEEFTMPGTEKYRIWTFKKENKRLKLFCNGEEIFNFNYGNSPAECRSRWSNDLPKISFPSNDDFTDTASDFYRGFTHGINANIFDILSLYYFVLFHFNSEFLTLEVMKLFRFYGKLLSIRMSSQFALDYLKTGLE